MDIKTPIIGIQKISTLKHRYVYEKICGDILQGKYQAGQPIPSENELAKYFNASRPTINRAMNELARNGFISRHKGSGSFIKKRSQMKPKIGLLFSKVDVFPSSGDIYPSIFPALVAEMSRVAGRREYNILLDEPVYGKSENELIEHAWKICKRLIDDGINAVFFLPFELSAENNSVNQKIAETFDKAGLAVILLDKDITVLYRSKYDIVGINNEYSSFLITDHLLKLGRTKLEFVAIGHNVVSSISNRFKGFKQALQSYEQKVDHKNIIRINSADGIHIDISNKEIFKEIKRTNTDAIVCANDLTAAFLMRYLLDMGLRIPDNIAIVGFDDLPLAAHLPVPLTTIRQPLTALAYEAVSSAIERIENPNLPPRDIMVGTQLVIRSSCGAGKQIF